MRPLQLKISWNTQPNGVTLLTWSWNLRNVLQLPYRCWAKVIEHMTPEGKLKKEVKRVLDKHKVWYYMPVQNGMGVTGIPDFVCCDGGRFIGIETKALGKHPTPNQIRIGDAIHNHGGVWMVVHSADEVESYFSNKNDDLRRAVWEAVQQARIDQSFLDLIIRHTGDSDGK